MANEMNDTGITIAGPRPEGFEEILTPEALAFVGSLAREFDPQRRALLSRREQVQAEIDDGKLPDFLPETEDIRNGDWKIAPIPADLRDRRVEITGPVDRKMVINALNSGARTYMADFEDSHAPTWEGTIQGQSNLRDAVNRTITHTSPEGKAYQLNENPAVLIARPRGWHLVEKHVLVDGSPISASIFDFGLYFYHNAKALLERGSGPYFYLPKMESHLEAKLWNDIFEKAQTTLGVPSGSIKATVLIETILAAFEMDEILYALKDHSAGLNCGRWDYIFSFIKRFKNVPDYIFPDRAQITMTRHCMHSYSLLAVQTCHRRGAHAIGGMAAQIPIKNDPEANEKALQQVRNDKLREANDGHDGTWVAHPGLVPIALPPFNEVMRDANQIDRLREDVRITTGDLLKRPDGTITEQGLRTNVSVGLQYLASWLSGNGCVPINHLMEDAATAEISRTQVWQWIHHPQGILSDGRKVDIPLFKTVMGEALDSIRAAMDADQFEAGNFDKAAQLFEEIVTSDTLAEFLTLRAYDYLD
jgi:malate synthase